MIDTLTLKKYIYQSHLTCHLRLLAHVGFFSKTWSDNFRSVLIHGKDQESGKKYFIAVQKNIHLSENI